MIVKPTAAAVLILTVALELSELATAQCPAPSWSAMNSMPGANAAVHASVSWDPDGAGPASGGFSAVGGTPAANIARWDGSAWHPMGGGAPNIVYALAVHGGELFAGGGTANLGAIGCLSIVQRYTVDYEATAG